MLHTLQRQLALDVALKAAATLSTQKGGHAHSRQSVRKAVGQTERGGAGARPTPTHAWAHSINATHQRRCRALSATGKRERETEKGRAQTRRRSNSSRERVEELMFAYACICLNNSCILSKWLLVGTWRNPGHATTSWLGLAWKEYSLPVCCCCHCRCCCCCWLSHNYFDSTFTTSLWITQEVLAARRRVRLSSGKASLLRCCGCSVLFYSLPVPCLLLLLLVLVLLLVLSFVLFISLARVCLLISLQPTRHARQVNGVTDEQARLCCK